MKLCIFDMDGTLLDTEAIYTQVTQEILEGYGHNFDWSIKSKMMGQKALDAAIVLIEALKLPMTPQEYLAERNEKHEKLFPNCKLLPGVYELVCHLKRANVPIAVATSSHRNAFLIKSKNHSQLFDMFGGNIICGDDPVVKRGKPHPDIFLETMKMMGVSDPRECLVFEDAESGIMAGLNAEMNVVAIPDPRLELPSDVLDRITLLKTMKDFDPAKFNLPPFE